MLYSWIRQVAVVSLFLSIFPQISYAYHPEEGLEFTSSVTNFNFSEFDNNQETMNLEETLNETGLIYGGEIRVKKAFDKFFLQGGGGISFGKVDYNGRTTGNTEGTFEPLATTTEETVEDWSISFGKIYESWRRHDYAVIYTGLGWHRWKRDIADKNDVTGLLELYTWWYVHVGARGNLIKLGPVQVLAELNLLHTLFPYMDVSFRGAFDSTTVKLGEHYGARFTLPVRVELTRNLQLLVEPYLEAWDLGRSEHVDLTAQGFFAGGTHEPQSKTRLYGINIGFAVRFD